MVWPPRTAPSPPGRATWSNPSTTNAATSMPSSGTTTTSVSPAVSDRGRDAVPRRDARRCRRAPPAHAAGGEPDALHLVVGALLDHDLGARARREDVLHEVHGG